LKPTGDFSGVFDFLPASKQKKDIVMEESVQDFAGHSEKSLTK
jgi:hypothetical protein